MFVSSVPSVPLWPTLWDIPPRLVPMATRRPAMVRIYDRPDLAEIVPERGLCKVSVP
jgi:hypothetical protein